MVPVAEMVTGRDATGAIVATSSRLLELESGCVWDITELRGV